MKVKGYYESYKRGQVIYADLGHKAGGVQSGIRPCVVVSRNESNHRWAPQITVCPLSSNLKDKLVHLKIKPLDVNGYHLKAVSDLLPEDMQTISKNDVRGTIGFIAEDSEVMQRINEALMIQLGLMKYSTK